LTWSEAFLRQARSDLSIFALLREQGEDTCHQIHYLQMAGEKLAKSESAEAGRNERPTLTHYGLSKWLQLLSLSNAEVRRLEFRSIADFNEAKGALVSAAKAVEHLAPKIANDRSKGLITHSLWNGVGTNAEYPWDQGGNLPISPVEYDFNEAELSALRLHRLALVLDARIAQKLNLHRVLPTRR